MKMSSEMIYGCRIPSAPYIYEERHEERISYGYFIQTSVARERVCLCVFAEFLVFAVLMELINIYRVVIFSVEIRFLL